MTLGRIGAWVNIDRAVIVLFKTTNWMAVLPSSSDTPRLYGRFPPYTHVAIRHRKYHHCLLGGLTTSNPSYVPGVYTTVLYDSDGSIAGQLLDRADFDDWVGTH
jgi:hypothetical protein